MIANGALRPATEEEALFLTRCYDIYVNKVEDFENVFPVILDHPSIIYKFKFVIKYAAYTESFHKDYQKSLELYN